jgi:CheY-like chemotaxis protein
VLIGLLEDDLAIQEMLRLVLQSEGHELVIYSLAADCLKDLRVDDPVPGTFSPDLLIVDLYLPKSTSGTTVIEQIRANPRFDALPLVLMTASSLPDKQQLERLRVKLLPKPFDIDDFLHLVDDLTSHV